MKGWPFTIDYSNWKSHFHYAAVTTWFVNGHLHLPVLGVRTESWTLRRDWQDVRMYSREERMKAIKLYIKNEVFYNRSWAGVSIDGFMDILDEYLHWYSEKRIKMSLGAMSPLEHRNSLGLAV